MSITKGAKKAFIYIGTHIKPIYPVLGVAAAQTIFKPLCTMMDDKVPEETKKYTALREGITEVIAASTYFACNKLGETGAKLFKEPKAAERAKHNLGLLGIWTAALVVIPGVCSLVVKPFTDKIYNRDKKNENSPSKVDVTSSAPEVKIPAKSISQTGHLATYSPVQRVSLSDFRNGMMKVGG